MGTLNACDHPHSANYLFAIMNDTFWNEFDAFINGTTDELPAPPPTALAPIAPTAPFEDTVLLAPPTPTVAMVSPFAFPSVQASQAAGVGDSVESANVNGMAADRTFSLDIETLRASFAAIVDKIGNKITFMRFKKEAVKAWIRKYPDAKKQMNKFQLFVKDNIKDVRANNPNMSHGDHMKMLGRMWNDTKPQIVGTKRSRQE